MSRTGCSVSDVPRALPLPRPPCRRMTGTIRLEMRHCVPTTDRQEQIHRLPIKRGGLARTLLRQQIMSRRTRTRRLARRARASRQAVTPGSGKEPWGSGPELTPQERARVLSRYADMRCRSFRFGFVFPLAWVRARNPEELVEVVRLQLNAALKGKAAN